MLTKKDKEFLDRLPSDKKVSIRPFDPAAKRLGLSLVKKIKNKFPNVKVVYTGSIMLGISGQQDIDIFVLSNPDKFKKYLPFLKQTFGKPEYVKKDQINWFIKKRDFVIDLYLASPKNPGIIRQLKIFKVLKSNKKLLKKYDLLKKTMNGKSIKEYQKRKFEFFNKILKENLQHP